VSATSAPAPQALKVTGLTSGYAGSTVLNGIDLTIGVGETVALLGRNGVGKSTFVNTVMGLVPVSSGSVEIRGVDLTGRRTDAIARAGVAIVPQGRRAFSALTVAEHLAIAERLGRRRPGDEWGRVRILDLLPRLGERLGHRADQLSGGEAQMLVIARALLLRPQLLLLDEPSDGLAPEIVRQVGEVIREVCDQGITVLLVEQDLRLAFSVADRVAVIEKGRIVLDVPTADFRADAERARALLGVG
jgi:branched-chain amino acid transport system ATP-binding protein